MKVDSFWAGGRRVSIALILFLLLTGTTPSGGLATGPVSETLSTESIMTALDVPDMWGVMGTTLGSDPRGVGVYTSPLGGFPVAGHSFIILSTGIADHAYHSDLNQNEQINQGGTADDTSTILRGSVTNARQDLVQVQLTLYVPVWARGFAFDFGFFTEEWPDYYASPYNDTFVAQVRDQSFVVNRYGGVNAPGNVVYDTNGHLVSTSIGFGFDPEHQNPDTGTTFDGTTGLLTTSVPLDDVSEPLLITFSLFDVQDSIVDSAVFLDNFRFLQEAPAAPQTVPQVETPALILAEDGKATGGGCLTPNSRHACFSGNTFATGNGRLSGRWQYTSESGLSSFEATELTRAVYLRDPGRESGMPHSPYNTARIEGIGKFNGSPGYKFLIWMADRGEPGDFDEFAIQVFDETNQMVLVEFGTLATGNVQIHRGRLPD